MKKIQLCFLLLACLCFARPAFSQITNTDHSITVTGSCLPLPSGTYDMTLYYASDGGAPTQTYPGVTVSTTGNTLTITGPANSFPTLASDGYSLAETYGGYINLTGVLGTGYISWNTDPFGTPVFDCQVVPIYIDHFTGTRTGSTVNLAWDTELEQNTTYIEIYRSTPGSSDYYKVGQVAAAGNSNTTRHYTYTDNNIGSTNTYYLKMLRSGPAIFSNTISFSCSTCTYTPPAPVYCSQYSINGPGAICTNGALGSYSLNLSVPNYNTITWSVDNSSLAALHTYPAYDRTQVTLRRKSATAAGVTLTASLSGCINTFSKVIGLGTPDPVLSGEQICPYVNIHMDNTPGATNYAWTQMDVSTNVTQNWPSAGFNNQFYIGDGDVYSFQAQYTNACGTSNLVWISSFWCAPCGSPPCGFDPGGDGFAVAPNPSSGMVTIGAAPADMTAGRAATTGGAVKTNGVVTTTGVAGTTTGVVKTTDGVGKLPAGAGATTGGAVKTSGVVRVYQIKVVDMKGAILKTFNYPDGSEKVSLDLSGLVNGIYVLRIYDSKSWKSSKLVIAK